MTRDPREREIEELARSVQRVLVGWLLGTAGIVVAVLTIVLLALTFWGRP